MKYMYRVTGLSSDSETKYFLDKTQAEAYAESKNRCLYAEYLDEPGDWPPGLSFEGWLEEQLRWILASDYYYVEEEVLSDREVTDNAQ